MLPYLPWSPIDAKSYTSENSDTDEEDNDQVPNNKQKIGKHEPVQFQHDEEELMWDSSPEQYQIFNGMHYQEENSQNTPQASPTVCHTQSQDSDSDDPTVDHGGRGIGTNNLKLSFNGNERTMNLNPLILTNIQGSPYFKVIVCYYK